MTGVISALPVNHRVGGSLENLILKISSRVNDRHCLWGKLLSSMIRYRLNVRNYSIMTLQAWAKTMGEKAIICNSPMTIDISTNKLKNNNKIREIKKIIMNTFEQVTNGKGNLEKKRKLKASV